jgi:aminopeptidase N
MDDIAMENVGCVILAEYFIASALSAKFWEICMHELSHMWFGNLVTMKWWDDLWLNEGFACFMSFYAIEHSGCESFSHIKDTIWKYYLRSYKYWGIRKDSTESRHPVYCAEITDSDKSEANFDGITYGKGAAFVQLLHRKIGHDAFKRGLHLYFEKNAWKNTELNDFFSAMEAAYGHNLRDMGDIWLKTAGINVLTPTLLSDQVLSVVQTCQGDEILRPHVLDIGFYGE